MKFGTMHLGPPQPVSLWHFLNLKIKMAHGRHLEKSKNCCISWSFDWFYKIWHSNASGPYAPDGALKIYNFENQRWQTAAFWKIEQSPYLHNHLIDFDEIWHDASGTTTASPPLKFPKFENPKWRMATILKNLKIAISPQPFDRFWLNLAW